MRTKKDPAEVPPYRKHVSTGSAYVNLSGRRIYLGKYGTKESRIAYNRLVAEWLSRGCTPPVDQTDLTVMELCDQYLEFAKEYYKPGMSSSDGQLDRVRATVRVITDLYGPEDAAAFGPMKLQTVRDVWIRKGYARSSINSLAGTAKRIWKWGASKEIVPASVWHALQTVAGLRRGRSGARESAPVLPVPQEHIDAVLPLVSPQVATMIRLQLLTACRPGEIVSLTPANIDTTQTPWVARPTTHKNAWRGHDRIIFLGPKAQELVRPYLLRPADKPLFSPSEAERARYAHCRSHRRPDQKPDIPETDRSLGNVYDVHAYANAIRRACRDVRVPTWTPHRLRHNAATELRRQYGIEVAALMLGHARVEATEIYAEKNQARARQLAAEIG